MRSLALQHKSARARDVPRSGGQPAKHHHSLVVWLKNHPVSSARHLYTAHANHLSGTTHIFKHNGCGVTVQFACDYHNGQLVCDYHNWCGVQFACDYHGQGAYKVSGCVNRITAGGWYSSSSSGAQLLPTPVPPPPLLPPVPPQPCYR
jgi:hypothetical protein